MLYTHFHSLYSYQYKHSLNVIDISIWPEVEGASKHHALIDIIRLSNRQSPNFFFKLYYRSNNGQIVLVSAESRLKRLDEADKSRKFEQSACFGVVTSASCNTIWAADPTNNSSTQRNTGAGRAYVGANEEVLCWDVKKGELLSRWRDSSCTAEVTAIARSQADPDVFAVGYADGSIRLWDSRIASVVINFNGHRSAVTILTFDELGVRLASGSRDTDIVVWDLVSEVGLFKLRGHKDQITGLQFIQSTSLELHTDEQTNGESSTTQYLVSTSKEALIKIWDVESQYCIETHVTQSNGECWCLGLSPDGSGCITAGNDGELKVWFLDVEGLREHSRQIEGSGDKRYLTERGVFNRHSRERTTGVVFHPVADYVAIHGTERAIELWRIRSPTEVRKSLARKRKRKREKEEKPTAQDGDGDLSMVDGNDAKEEEVHITDVFVPYVIVRTGGKIRSIDWAGVKSKKSIQLVAATTNNQLEMYKISSQEKTKKSKTEDDVEYDRSFAVDLTGHRTDIRALSLSSDDRMLATASSGSLKIWNIKTQSCLRTLDCGYALSCVFLPGDKIVLVGNKNGELELFDIASSTLIDTIKAHEGAIWTLRVHPDGKSAVTGSADKTVKFWRFDIVQEDIPGTKRTTPRLKLTHNRTLKLNDDILSICFSPDSRLIAVSTLDNTVKVFFLDTLKLFLNLYGHKLPVLNISIASDSKLIATCSADKNIRLWGLDFGDCHKALYAHEDSIMSLSFIAHPIERSDSHFLFSASKDGLLKSWDADKFEHVQKLNGHHGEIWAMAVSRTGDFAVTASHDKSIRLWHQSDEPLFLEEERERELEEAYDTNLTDALARDQSDNLALADQRGVNDIAPPTKQTGDTLTASERIVEALTLCTPDLVAHDEHALAVAAALAANTPIPAPPQRSAVLTHLHRSAQAHLLAVFRAIPASALHDALLLLPFSSLGTLLPFLDRWLRERLDVALACRVLFFLVRTHQRQIVASGELRAILQDMRGVLEVVLGEWKGVMGFNLAAMGVLGRRVGESTRVPVEEMDEIVEEKAKGKKRGFVNVA